jgi:DNA-directed RNA polymerase sigma subunit (sigma70/sigma32)
MIDETNEIIRGNMIIFMNQKKITIKDIVKKQNFVGESSIYKYFNGERKISLKMCKSFSEIVNVKIQDLFDEENYNKYKDKYKKPYKKYFIKKNIYKISSNENRDKVIYFYRKLSSNKKTLQKLGNEFCISRERVRQIQKKYEEKNDR